eukprot:m.201529 g.201529  ORF g.201529 m.201529 type:complete len:121 (+) comp39599_c0_seq5:449-811(+)
MSSDCVKRLAACVNCWRRTYWKEMQEHNSLCPRKLIPCRFCFKTVRRNELANHSSTDCPKVTIECIYAEVGCKFKCERALLNNHLKDATTHHNRLLLEGLKKQKESFSKQMKEEKRRSEN